jgi:UDP-N-acetylglucosamine-lysosomal-enzyme
MIGTNHTDVRRALDGIRQFKHKFICLNDNMNHTDPESLKVVDVLKDFFESLVPVPSRFELPLGILNPTGLYIDDVKELYVEELRVFLVS